ncbi:MAG: HU family DNA-binding protein [Ruminococcus sp.]|nr:HU family DNA-binding protein [Ruminococcus sp.]
MTKSELISSLAKSMNCTKKDATAVIDATFAVIQETLEKGEKVSVTGFGTFEIRERDEKTCINPKTKEKMVCPPCKAPAFKAGRNLKSTINK